MVYFEYLKFRVEYNLIANGIAVGAYIREFEISPKEFAQHLVVEDKKLTLNPAGFIRIAAYIQHDYPEYDVLLYGNTLERVS